MKKKLIIIFLMGICDSSKDEKYKYEEKGMNEKHEHMLIFSNPPMRNKVKDFYCNCCSKKFENIGSFHCIVCNYNMCRECFDYSGGIIFNKYIEGKKGQINSHEHVLEYGLSKSKKEKGLKYGGLQLYTCKICGATFLKDYIKCWTCPLCDYDVCDKCFNQSRGTTYDSIS